MGWYVVVWDLPDGLQIGEEGNEETDNYGEELEGVPSRALVPEDEEPGMVFAAVAHHDPDDGAQHDGRRR